MRRSRQRVPAGLAVCCALTLAIVLLFREEVHTTTVMLLSWASGGVKPAFASAHHALIAWLDAPPKFSFTKLFVVLVLLVILIPLAIVLVGISIPLMLVLGWLGWLGVNVDEVFLFAFDVLIGWAAGAVLYGLVLPVLWLLLAPVLAFTLGELVYQRARARIGLHARYDQPLYLVAALICFAFAGLRVATPIVGQAAANWQQAAADLHPPTPTPNPWPRRFSVDPSQTVRTGIVVENQNLEFFVHPSKHVFVSLRKTGKNQKGSAEFLIRGRRPESNAEMFAGWTGEIELRGADEHADVAIWEPTYKSRHWLQAGETYRASSWVAAGEEFQFCGGWYLSYRTVGKAGTSAWRDLTDNWGAASQDGWLSCKPSLEPAARSGVVEFKARRRTWVQDGPTAARAYAKEMFVKVPAGAKVTVDLSVRPGDKVRVRAIDEAIYWVAPGDGETVIPRGNVWDRTLSYTGQVELKGGVMPGRASVLLLARGPNWK